MHSASKIFILLLLLALVALLVVPVFAEAQGWKGLVPCGKEIHPPDATEQRDGKTVNVGGTIKDKCNFKAFMALINNVLRFILFAMVVPIAAIMFAYAGALMVFSGGSTERVGQARRIFSSVALGLIIAVVAWLVIRTILAVLGFEGGWIGFPKL
jgi:hypothetical protein